MLGGIDYRLDSGRLFASTRRLLAHSREGRTDWVNPVCMLLLCVVGLVFIYSATSYSSANFWARQIIWIVLGGMVYVALSRIDYKFYLENAVFIYMAAIVLLLLILTPLGVEREGARRWLNIGIMNFQPSEAAKVGTLIMVASVLARNELGTVRESLIVLLKIFLITALPMFLIFRQPDLGSCLIIPPVALASLYVSKLSERFFFAVFGIVIVATGVLSLDLYRYSAFLETHSLSAMEARGQYQQESFIPFFHDYQRERIMGFIAPQVVDPTGTEVAWNAIQSQQAVGTGGLLGKGVKQGTQAQLGYLPRSVAHNDFIFAVVAEESGFIGGLFVIGLFGIMLGNGVRIAGMARDRFGMLLAVGVTVTFLIHIFINIGMTIGITPITGLPLPFVSYGGSFILSCFILQGIVQSVYRHRRDHA